MNRSNTSISVFLLRIVLKIGKIFLSIVVVLWILIASMICINHFASAHDDLEYGIERVYGFTGYQIEAEKSDLILHKSNRCDSIVFIQDWRSKEKITTIMEQLVEEDEHWSRKTIAEEDTYSFVRKYFVGSDKSIIHFKPVCNIDGGTYDYVYYLRKDHGDKIGCLVDVDTGTISLYIYLD